MQHTSTLPANDPAPKPAQVEGGEPPNGEKAANSVPDCDPKADQCAREDELLDEGLEETFPASDPVSAKHIT